MITIVTPIYNGGKFIERFVSALRNQTYQEFEVIFVCDESTDDSNAVLERSLQSASFQYKTIKRKGKGGVGSARDYPIEHGLIGGDYVIFLDVDDGFENNYLERLVGAAKKHKADCVICAYKRIDGLSGRTLSVEMAHYPEVVAPVLPEVSIALINPAPWNKLIRSSIIQDCRFTAKLGEDAMFFAELVPYLNSIAFISEPLYRYYVNEGSNVASTSSKGLEDAKKGFVRVRNFYSERYPTHPRLFAILVALVFLRVGIGMTLRSCLNVSRKECRAISKSTREYLDQEFASWRFVKTLRFASLVRLGLKGFLLWLTKVSIKWKMFPLVVAVYRTHLKIFHKDIKW